MSQFEVKVPLFFVIESATADEAQERAIAAIDTINLEADENICGSVGYASDDISVIELADEAEQES